RYIHGGEARHHALVFIEHLQRALARFRLIGRVGAVKLAPAGHRPDRGRDVVLVSSGAGEAEKRTVLAGPGAHQTRNLQLPRGGREIERAATQFRRYLVEKLVYRRRAERGEHLADIVFGVRNEW